MSDKALLTREELVKEESNHGGLVIIGSHVKKTTEQLEELKKTKEVEYIEFDVHLVLEHEKFQKEIGTKGLEVQRATVAGQIKPGIPVWKTGSESKFPGIAYVIFPGNVGTKTDLKEVVEMLTKKTNCKKMKNLNSI